MSTERLECDCGHRLALHTYFKDRSPCTRCRCATFFTSSVRETSSKNRETEREGAFVAAGRSAENSKTYL